MQKKIQNAILIIVSILITLYFVGCTLPTNVDPGSSVNPGTLEKPTIYPISNATVKLTDKITIDFMPNDAQLYFTIDGSMPNQKSILYTKSFTLAELGVTVATEQVVINAYVTKSGYKPSPIASSIYNIFKENEPALSSMVINETQLFPDFNTSETNYTANVPYAQNNITITSKAVLSTYAITVNGIAVEDNKPSSPIALNVGNTNVIKVKVTSGALSKEYTITVTRQNENPSNNANLTSLTLSSGSLTPGFSKNVLSYTSTVENEIETLTVSPILEDSKATVTVNGKTAGTPVTLTVGENDVIVQVIAEDGTKKEYKVKVTRKQPIIGTNANLSSLSISGLELTPSFNKDKLSYTGTVSNATTSVTIDAVSEDPKAKVEFASGNPAILAVGANELKVIVTAEDGKTIKTYVLNITREPKQEINGIKLHVYSPYKWVWVWETTDTTLNNKRHAMTDEGSSWYGITLNVESAKLIFTPADSWVSQTSDLSRTKGEWWYKDNTWFDYDPIDLEDPTCMLISPSSGASITGKVTIKANATDNKAVAKVEFYRDAAVKIGEDTSYPYEFEWNSALSPNGSHVIYAKAYDLSGRTKESNSITISTNNANIPPVADAGTNRRTVKDAVLTLSGSNSYDPNGTIKSYSWSFGDGTNGSGVTVNHSYTNLGTYTVTLTVTDNDNATATATITIEVKDQPLRTDFREETIYFVMTARFNDGVPSNNRYTRADDNSGNRLNNDPPWRGDFKGLIDKLDYIKALGFTAVWLTPVVQNRSDYDFHGYHAWDFHKIDARLETPGATYQDLINEVHKRGMKIIQDIVINHTSRYGAVGLQTVKYWGDRNDPEWGVNGTDPSIKGYYDEYNPNFVYNGLDKEPNSGKEWYNGDLWTKDKPQIWIGSPKDPAESLWGVVAGNVANKPYKWHYYQWPTLALFNPKYFHKTWLQNWEDETCQTGTMHEDCIDLNTESKEVQDHLIEAYNKMIDMGVDGFRVDTVKHVSRLMFNRRFIPAFKERGGENFYIFGEVCTRVNEVWNKGNAPLSTPFYTWKERKEYSSDDSVAVHEMYAYEWGQGTNNQPTSNNHELINNTYRKPDWSKRSGMDVIDFPMHWNFKSAGGAFGVKDNDKYYSDATWNVTYVQSHDYSPWEAPQDRSYRAPIDEATWAEDMSLMWTFRGIPCLYYGDEIQDAKGNIIDAGPTMPLAQTGRPYFGDKITGTVTVQDFGVWSNASGNISNTLNHPLAKHVQALNRIRRAIPALQKGQYSTENISGGIAFKRRYTDSTTDSFVLVTISQSATFNNIPNGKYTDAITGAVINVTNGSLTANVSGQGNMRVFVLDTALTKAPGQVAGSNYLK